MGTLIARIVMLALVALGASAQEKILAPAWVGPAFSGSWYTTSRSGEGFILQVLDNGTALLLWFTYPPAGAPGQQAWIYADGGRVEGDRIRFATSITTRGGRFGAAPSGGPAQRTPWGTIEFRFTGCNAGEVTYAGPAGWGSGVRAIERLTELSELGCGGKQRLTTNGARAMEGLRQRSGAWFNPAHDAEGWAYEELPGGGALLYWGTYDANGEQAWTYGEAPAAGTTVAVTNYRPVGTRFGDGFNPANVVRAPWGTVQLNFTSCAGGTLQYASSDAAFGTGTVTASRLTNLAGAVCHDQKPSVPASGTWSAGATMPVMHSEIGLASIGSRSCAAGGYAGQREFQCYDAATNAWTAMPPLPAGRDHGQSLAIDGDYYFTGGFGDNAPDGASGWRFRFAESRWESIPELPNVGAHGAATLNGFAYFASGSGVWQYNPRTREKRFISGDTRGPRDHAQLAAFQGELWSMGGRGFNNGAHSIVSIFDPASETWRAGPPLGQRRSGFAAAANGTTLFVAGGERLDFPNQVVASVEAIAAGDTTWSPLQSLPFAVHGMGGALHGNALYVIGGSRQAATALNFGDVQVYRFGP